MFTFWFRVSYLCLQLIYKAVRLGRLCGIIAAVSVLRERERGGTSCIILFLGGQFLKASQPYVSVIDTGRKRTLVKGEL